ncbi:adenylate kinase 8-like isoform X1 [Cydia splendana]|uniref:adenylate kinase 8-like isoform X1 n=1 Tax=Cydia splendana TaxID=1100963 RepID=UPI0028F47DB0
MTETDAAADPVDIPVTFLPYLEKYRLYKLFKDMMQDLIVNLPRDPLKHMKNFLRNIEGSDSIKLMLLVSPELNFDVPSVVKAMIKDFGFFVITRRTILDHYEKHDDFKPGCVDTALMSEVTKAITFKDEVIQNGWLMYDHPCTLREARCLQQDGVIPTVALAIMPTPPVAPPAINNRTKSRNFFQQDFQGLLYAYKVSLKEVHIDPSDSIDTISSKCFNAIRACSSGAQGPKQGFHATGAPGVYRVALIGPRGAGRKTQAALLAKHFGLVCLNFRKLFAEASAGDDDIGKWLRQHGPSVEMKAQIVRRRLLEKDCIDYGYVITSFPTSGAEFELFDNMETPPNRIIFMNTEIETCKSRILARGVDWCTGKSTASGAPRSLPHPRDSKEVVEAELDFYFSEGVAEMRAAAGLSAWEIDSNQPIDQVQTKLQAAIMAAPSCDIKVNQGGVGLENARIDKPLSRSRQFTRRTRTQ